jgi:hypothetical protein
MRQVRISPRRGSAVSGLALPSTSLGVFFTWQRSPDGTYMNAHSVAFTTTPLRRALALAALGALACTGSAAAFAQDAKRADQVRAYNAQVLKLQAELRRSKAGAPNARAVEVLAARAATLRTLMATDPTAAEKLAFPATVLEQLAASFPGQAASLEQRGRWEGEFEYTIEDSADLKSHRNVYRLHRAGEVLDVEFAGKEPPGLTSGKKLGLSGVRSGRKMVATEVELMDAAMGAGDHLQRPPPPAGRPGSRTS